MDSLKQLLDLETTGKVFSLVVSVQETFVVSWPLTKAMLAYFADILAP